MNSNTTGGDNAATIHGADRAAGYQTKDERPASVADGAHGDDRDRDGGYLHREIAPQGHRADSRGNPQPRAVVAPLRNR